MSPLTEQEWAGWMEHDTYRDCRYREARDAKQNGITVYILSDGAVDHPRTGGGVTMRFVLSRKAENARTRDRHLCLGKGPYSGERVGLIWVSPDEGGMYTGYSSITRTFVSAWTLAECRSKLEASIKDALREWLLEAEVNP